MSRKYAILVKILDQIREEARGTKWANQYAVDNDSHDAVMAARSRAYIHLYLKVMFGIGRFEEREAYVTDGSYDGGIDGFLSIRSARKSTFFSQNFVILKRILRKRILNMKNYSPWILTASLLVMRRMTLEINTMAKFRVLFVEYLK